MLAKLGKMKLWRCVPLLFVRHTLWYFSYICNVSLNLGHWRMHICRPCLRMSWKISKKWQEMPTEIRLSIVCSAHSVFFFFQTWSWKCPTFNQSHICEDYASSWSVETFVFNCGVVNEVTCQFICLYTGWYKVLAKDFLPSFRWKWLWVRTDGALEF